MDWKDVDFYEKVQAQTEQLHKEFSILAKSKADGVINVFKLKLVNEKLRGANAILVGPFKPLCDFDEFSEDSLPTNSDVVLVLSQYLECLEGWRSANVTNENYRWIWNTNDGSKIDASAPSRFRQASAIGKRRGK